jgi:hypothetical protein
MNAPPINMTMGTPGAPNQALIARSREKQAGPQERLGLMPMAPHSRHNLTINGKPHAVDAKPRNLYREAKGACFCMGPGCYTKKGPVAWYADEKELRAAHDPQDELVDRAEKHVFGFWSSDPCNPPDPGCAACKKASADATKAARAADAAAPEAARPCAEHSGGEVGLLTPGDPGLEAA